MLKMVATRIQTVKDFKSLSYEQFKILNKVQRLDYLLQAANHLDKVAVHEENLFIMDWPYWLVQMADFISYSGELQDGLPPVEILDEGRLQEAISARIHYPGFSKNAN